MRFLKKIQDIEDNLTENVDSIIFDIKYRPDFNSDQIVESLEKLKLKIQYITEDIDEEHRDLVSKIGDLNDTVSTFVRGQNND